MVFSRFIFVTILLFFIVIPTPAISANDRGVKPVSVRLQSIDNLGSYHAIIIGINTYKEWNPLKTAVKDAQALEQILIERYGFKKSRIILRTDHKATRVRLIQDLRILASNLGSQDNLLIYYAGHGQLDDLTGDGYWIPVEGKLKNPATWISHSTIKNILSSQSVKGKNIVVVADSCYSGTLLRGGPSLLSLTQEGYHRKLLKLAARRSRQVITSGGLEPVADGGRDGHSLFAYYFLKALKENKRQIIDIENLFHTYVWKPVTEIGDQRPNVGRLKTPMDEDGQFVLFSTDTKRPPASIEKVDTKLEAEKKRLAAESERVERERRELEQLREKFETQQRLAEEKKRLEAERQRIEEEKLKLASIPKAVTTPRMTLRKKPMEIANQAKITDMLIEYDFFESSKNPRGAFENVFIDNNDGTITDRATGLMWQKSGSLKSLDNRSTKEYIKRLNRQKLAGYSDWRIPTIDELASLLKRRRKSGVHMDPVFNNKQFRCWSADQADTTSSYYSGAWIISFKLGEVTLARWLSERSATYGAGSGNKNIMNYLKAVRNLELASIPKTATVARISLRKKPLMISSEKKINSMLAKYGFFDISRNPLGSFENQLVDNNDGTVTDRATGLMWQKSGSSKSLYNREAIEYIKRLNRKQYAGYSDWRMPTVEELASLLNTNKINGVHMDLIFDNKQIRCWTVDQFDTSSWYLKAWIINFKLGEVSQAICPNQGKQPTWQTWTSTQNHMNFVKTVRSVK